MNKELRQAMIKILEDLARDSDAVFNTAVNTPAVVNNAKLALFSARHIASLSEPPSSYRITLSGFNYLEELKHPVRTRLKLNLFAATVAAATLMLALGSSIAQLWTAFG